MASSQQKFNAGQSHGQAQAKTEEWIQSTKDTANAAKDRVASATQSNSANLSTNQSAQQNKEEAAGFLQQTGEQVLNMAQGAVDTMKNTLGVGDKKN